MDRYTDVETRQTIGPNAIDERISDILCKRGTYSLDELSRVLPEAGWSQVFLAH